MAPEDYGTDERVDGVLEDEEVEAVDVWSVE